MRTDPDHVMSAVQCPGCPKCRPPWCAICTAPIAGTPSRQPLGRDGAMVTVCTECDDVHPRSGRYAFSVGGAPDQTVGAGNSRMGPNGGSAKSRGGR